MPQAVNTQPKPESTRSGSSDRYVLAAVEKWMAMIREISLEQAKH
jgi:hypothetical protein